MKNMNHINGVIPTISVKEAARLLITPTSLGELGLSDAMRVIEFMKPQRIKEDTVFIREGEKVKTDFMMLVLSGDARVQSGLSVDSDEMIVGIIGPGHLLGEMALFNGSSRSATCTAISELAVAVLTRASLKRMMTEQPELAARFLSAVSSRTAERLRETTSKLKKFIQLSSMLQKEVYLLMDSQDREMKPVHRKKASVTAPSSSVRFVTQRRSEGSAVIKHPKSSNFDKI